MKIIRNTHEEKQFKDLCMGDVFITADDNGVYMKTDKAYEFPDNRDYYYNAVNLYSGSLVKISDWEKVLVPQNATLTIDE